MQGGEQVIEDSHLKIKSLSQDEVVAQSDRSLTCRYLMELSDHSKRWVRFTIFSPGSTDPSLPSSGWSAAAASHEVAVSFCSRLKSAGEHMTLRRAVLRF